MAKTLYTAEATVTGGRAEGHGKTTDGNLEVDLRPPKEVGGDGDGTNPEALFAVGYAACFESVSLDVSLPSVNDAEALELAKAAHRVCPYSNATRGNIDVALTANGQDVG